MYENRCYCMTSSLLSSYLKQCRADSLMCTISFYNNFLMIVFDWRIILYTYIYICM